MSLRDVNYDDLKSLGFESYRDYLLSDRFREIRSTVLDRDGRLCSYCQESAEHVKFLSFTVDVLSGDDLSQVTSICTNCYLP